MPNAVTTKTSADPDRGDGFAVVVGNLTHVAIARLVSEGDRGATAYLEMLRILDVSRAVCHEFAPTGARNRALFQAVATSSGIYMHRYAMNANWHFIGAEVSGPGGRADLVWAHEKSQRCVIDEVKTGTSRNGHPAAKAQVGRYQRLGRELYKDDFAGVRLLWIGLPASSQWYSARSAYGVALSSVPEDAIAGWSA